MAKVRSYLDLISAGRRRQIEREYGKMSRSKRMRMMNLKERMVQLMMQDGSLPYGMRADRVIATVLDYFETVTPEMADMGVGAFMVAGAADNPTNAVTGIWRAMLAAARDEVRK